MFKVRPFFWWWCCVCCCSVLLTLCIHYFTSPRWPQQNCPLWDFFIIILFYWIELNLLLFLLLKLKIFMLKRWIASCPCFVSTCVFFLPVSTVSFFFKQCAVDPWWKLRIYSCARWQLPTAAQVLAVVFVWRLQCLWSSDRDDHFVLQTEAVVIKPRYSRPGFVWMNSMRTCLAVWSNSVGICFVWSNRITTCFVWLEQNHNLFCLVGTETQLVLFGRTGSELVLLGPVASELVLH